MNNAVTTQANLQLPAHLQALAGRGSTSIAAMGGITSGPSIHQISIKAARWRLQDPQGQEVVVPQHFLDVIIVDANPNASKIYYAGQYNPAETEFKAPDCYSDNGVAPAARAINKQSTSCATCPNNVWGSKITPTGGQTKACADAKKLAVILAENPTGPVYLLKIPPASLKNLFGFVESLANRGIDLPLLVVRLEFDTQADYPKITFSPQNWISEQQAASVQKLANSDEVKTVIGMKEIGSAPAAQLTAPAAPVAPAPLPPVQETVAEKPRRAPKKAAESVAPPTESGFFANLKAANAPAPAAPAPAVAQVVVNPPATSQALDDLIAQAMKV